MAKMMRMDKLAIPGLALALFLTLPLAIPQGVEAEQGRMTVVAQMPRGIFRASAVWTGTEVMIFGGRDESTVWAEVSTFDPSRNIFEDKGLLPEPRMSAPVIWTGTHALIFAGIDQTTTTFAAMKDTMLRYDPVTNSTTVMSARFPTPRIGMSGGWDGTSAYVFGGFNNSVYLTTIFRYNVSTDTLQLMPSVLPYGLAGSSAVWTGGSFYIFGGRTGPTFHDQILRYDPVSGAVNVLDSRLPGVRFHASATWFKGSVYVFGGRNSSGTVDQIVKFTPATGAVELLSIRFPIGREYTSSATDGESIYIFGGNTDADYALKEILRFDPDFIKLPGSSDIVIEVLAGALIVVIATVAFEVVMRKRTGRGKDETK